MVVYGASPLGHVLCCDATIVSPLTRNGIPHARSADHDGTRLLIAERRKKARYPEILRGRGTRLLVLGCEVGGRWSQDTGFLVRELARLRARACPAALRSAASGAWQRRWWCLLSVASQMALAQTMLDMRPAGGSPTGFDDPCLADVLEENHGQSVASRMPLRATV